MITLPIGMLILAAILYTALGHVSLKTLLNPEAVVLVAAGCVGVLAFSAPLSQLKNLLRAVLSTFRPVPSTKKIDQVLMDLAKNRMEAAPNIHPLIGYAQELWNTGVSHELFVTLLTHKLREMKHSTEGAVVTLRNLAKFPPALGMTGTVIGLVSLFSNLTPENKGKLGPSLGLAMTATLYGLVIANMLLLPLSDRLSVMHIAQSEVADKVFGVLMLIHDGEPEDVIEVKLNAEAA